MKINSSLNNNKKNQFRLMFYEFRELSFVRIGWFELRFGKRGQFHVDRFVRWV